MTSAEHIRMTPQRYKRLQNELAALRSRRSIEVLADYLDYDANLLTHRVARRARIRQIKELLTKAVVGGEPVGDPIAEPGMVLTIRYDDTGETETFLLGRRGAENVAIAVYSMASPLGRAIAGAHPGEQRSYAIPQETERPVTLLDAMPYEQYAA